MDKVGVMAAHSNPLSVCVVHVHVHINGHDKNILVITLYIKKINPLYFMSLFHVPKCFEHHMLILKRSKLFYTVSGIITPIGGRPIHRLRESSLKLCTGRPPIGVMIPEAV